MKARDKAKELVGQYINLLNGSFDIAIQCALIAVEQILDNGFDFTDDSKYWKEVKQEIEKL